LLKEGWLKLPEDEKDIYREWTEWDKKRYARDVAIFEGLHQSKKSDAAEVDTDDMKAVHVPKKRKQQKQQSGDVTIKKKKS
jgi:hypothetical protein